MNDPLYQICIYLCYEICKNLGEQKFGKLTNGKTHYYQCLISHFDFFWKNFVSKKIIFSRRIYAANRPTVFCLFPFKCCHKLLDPIKNSKVPKTDEIEPHLPQCHYTVVHYSKLGLQTTFISYLKVIFLV